MEGVTGSIPVPPTSLRCAKQAKAAAPKRSEGGADGSELRARRAATASSITARPPEISNTAPVENEQSPDDSRRHQRRDLVDRDKRFIGIFDSM